MRRGFGILGAVLTLVVIAVVGVIAYQIGWSDGLAQHVPANTDGGSTAVAPYPYYWYGGVGFFHFGWIFGLLFFLFFVFVFFRIIAFGLFGGWRRRGWGHYGRGWGMSGGGIPPAIDERMREWHRQAHEAPPAPPTGGTSTSPPPPPTAQQ